MGDESYKIEGPSPLKQLGASLLVGVAAAVITYMVTDAMAKPAETVGAYQSRGAYRFVFYMTALVGGVAFIVTMTIYKKLADRKYAASLGPPTAKVVDRGS